ncbi:MAG TPA: hypothetical protein VF607_10445 [Verrucomicrobiae bacterium]
MKPVSPESKIVPPGFAALADAKAALKEMVPPYLEEYRTAFIAKLSESPHPKQLAFRLLAMLVTNTAGKNEKVLSLLQTELTAVLSGDIAKTPEELPGSSSEDVKVWVRQQFPCIVNIQEANQYFDTEQHLWTLYQILLWSTDTAKFLVALTSFTDELESLTMAGSGGKRRRRAKKTGGFSTVVTTLIKRVPSHPTALESLLENLRLCRACAAVSAELQEQLANAYSRNDRLKIEIEGERTALAAERKAREAAEASVSTADNELAKARAEVSRLEEALKIQAGAHETDKLGASAEVLSAIRRKIIPDLENIRLYADRSEPNAPAIVRKAQELTQFLNDFKQT